MPNAFPETPQTLLSRLEERKTGMPFQDDWRLFFDLYHGPLRTAALGTFRHYNWTQVPEDVLEEVITDVVVSFFKAEFSYDPKRGKFRNYLRQLVVWRIKDRFGRLPSTPPASLDAMDEAELADPVDDRQPAGELESKEQASYRAALFATMLEDVRKEVSPQTFLIFEMTKIQGCNPNEVAGRFKIKRNVVDNAAYRVLEKLRQLASRPEYRKEYDA